MNIPNGGDNASDPGADQPRLPYRRPKVVSIGATDQPYLSRAERDELLAMVPRSCRAVLDAHFVVGRSGEVWASREELADRAGVPPRSFDRHRARLVAAGVLVLVHHSSRSLKGRPGRNARYRLVRPADIVAPVEPVVDEAVATEPEVVEQERLDGCRWCLSTDHDHDACPARPINLITESLATMANDSEPDHSPLWRMNDAQSLAKVAHKASKNPLTQSEGVLLVKAPRDERPDEPARPLEAVGPVEKPPKPSNARRRNARRAALAAALPLADRRSRAAR